ncbi:MAG: MoaD/ThiS family protein [Candidatus Bipolaricaulota bacterium]|nr:MAG: MoaD/ThiS family protein [Candidatus Bipolaricaulota bacterium]
MQVEVRRFASLVREGVPGRAGEPAQVELPPSATIDDLLETLELRREEVHLVMVNGRTVSCGDHVLGDGDRVGLFPPVGGG